MSFFLILFSALFSLFLWSYIVTYCMHLGASGDFFTRARIGVFRGMIVAGVFLLLPGITSSLPIIDTDWMVLPVVFFLGALPFVHRRLGWRSFLPLFLGIIPTFFLVEYFSPAWSPFHEEIGKWYQSLTNTFPVVMSPFVGIGFSFVENISYYSHEITLSQVIGRTLLSLPLHLFAVFFGLWCLMSIRSRSLGIIVGLLASTMVHFLYNWSLQFSILLTLIIVISGYLFYGWSLEKSWWKQKI